MATKYLQVYYTSEVFEYSKTPQPEFEEHINSKGTKSYRNYYTKGVQGTLESVSIQNYDFGTRVMVTLKNEEDLQIMQFSLNDQRNNIDNFTESLIRVLPNMVKGENYWVYPYVISPEDQKAQDEAAGNDIREKYYESSGVSVKHFVDGVKGDKVEPALVYKGDGDNVIPQIVWKVDPATKKKKPSAVSLKAKNEFLTAKLMEATEGHLKRETTPNTPSSAPEATPVPKKEASAPVMADDDNELPF